jgi:predicted RNase H-like HicB family nuclease
MEDMTTRYIALLDGKRGAYGVAFPDLPGCTAMGRTMDEALRNAAEAVSEWAGIGRGPLPRARSLEALLQDPAVKDALLEGASLVVVPLIRDANRPAKANISLDAGLLEAIDDAARAHGLTRSAFLATAAREKIAGTRKEPA